MHCTPHLPLILGLLQTCIVLESLISSVLFDTVWSAFVVQDDTVEAAGRHDMAVTKVGAEYSTDGILGFEHTES